MITKHIPMTCNKT